MITRKGKPYRELRCTKCRTLLALEYIFAGRISIKCHVCNTLNDIECTSAKKVLLDEGSIRPTTLISDTNLKGGEK
jgi:LSD1 subclass zinc finger protein